MDHVWKILSAMVLIEVPILIYFYVVNTNDSTTMKSFENIEVEERDRIPFGVLTKANASFEPTTYTTMTEATSLTNVNMAIKTEKSKHLNTHTVNQKTSKEMRTKVTNYSLTDVKYANKKKVNMLQENKSREISCTLSFEDQSLLKAREKLSKPFYLFYIHLETDDFKYMSDNDRDALLHWQYVLKDEKFLVQLPVDVDFLTFNLLMLDNEETTISIKLINNNSNCFHQDYSDTLRSIQFLLWNKLFHNNTNYFLCNRHYEDAIGRFVLFYVTTIWIGYDLTCSEMSSTQGRGKDIKFEKGCTPVITSIFCYVLSLQCVWIFVLLDIKKNSIACKEEEVEQNPAKKFHDETSETDTGSDVEHADSAGGKAEESCQKHNENKTSNSPEQGKNNLIPEINSKSACKCCPEFLESDEKPFYKRKDRPYGMRRFVTKLLYSKWCFCQKCCLHHPATRLQFLVWVTILLPFGFYRTFGRYCSLKQTYEDYFNVAEPGEPILHFLPEGYIVPFDIMYATCCPVIYILVVHILLDEFLRSKTRMCCYISKYKAQTFIIDNGKLSDRFLFSYFQFSRELCACFEKDCCKNENNCKRCCKQCCCNNCGGSCCNNCEECCSNYCYNCCCNECEECYHRDKKKCTENCNNCCKNCPKHCNTCCNSFKMCCISKSCSSVCTCICGCFYCTFPCIPLNCLTQKYLEYCNFSEANSTKKIFCVGLKILLLFFSTLFLYLLCLRPLFSTFTFLIRSFTYIVFVLFPIRPYFMRIAIMFVTAFIYFSKYIHELINMNAEILSFIFELEEEKQLSEEKIAEKNRGIGENMCSDFKEETYKIESIDEEKFDSIYQTLTFARRKFYTLCLKILVVIMYLFITFETFITNTKSLNGSNFKDIIQFLLILIGPYAIVYFLKANDSDFLTEENKKEIKKAYKNYTCEFAGVESLSTETHYNESNNSEREHLLSEDNPNGQNYNSINPG